MRCVPNKIAQVAEVLGVSVDALFAGPAAGKTRKGINGGPVGKVRQTFEAVSKLPRRQQQHIVRVVSALVAQAKDVLSQPSLPTAQPVNAADYGRR